MNIKDVGNKTIGLFVIIAAGLIGAVSAYSLLFPVNKDFTSQVLPNAALTLVFLAIGFGLYYFLKDKKIVAPKRSVFLLFALVVAVQLLFGLALMGDTSRATWDAGIVTKQASLLAGMDDTSGDPLIKNGYQGYYNMYPNNAMLTTILTVWYKLFAAVGIKDTAIASLILNVLVMNAALLMSWWIAKRLFGAKISYVVLAIGFVFITLSPWVRVAYSDTIGILFPIAILFFYIRLIDARSLRNRFLWSALIGAFTGVGYGVKPTVIFAFIAICLDALRRVIVHRSRNANKLKLAMPLAAVVLVTAVTAYSLGYWYIDKKIDIQEQLSVPVSHFLMIGSTKVCVDKEASYCKYGGYNNNDWKYYIDNYAMLPNSEAYSAYTTKEAFRRIAELGYVGYMGFILDKSSWVMGDGTFAAYQEGIESKTPPTINNEPVAEAIQNVAYPGGEGYKAFTGFMNAAWSVLVVGLVFLVVRIKKINKLLAPAVLSVAALLTFLMVFEARSRYIFLYLPVIAILSAYGLRNMFAGFFDMIGKVKVTKGVKP